MVEFFKGLSFFFLPLGLGSKRIDFFENRIRKHGGNLARENSYRESFVVLVEDSVSERKENCSSALKEHGLLPGSREKIRYLRLKWLSKCLEEKRLIETGPYEIEWLSGREEELCKVGKEEEEEECRETSREEKRKNEEEDGETSRELKRKLDHSENEEAHSKPSTSGGGKPSKGCNQAIVEELEKLANAYELRKDTWRSHGYRKAIAAIKSYDREITTFQEARDIPRVGEKMASKIMEIIETGKLKKVEEVVDEKTKVLDEFCRVWGVGPSTAERWYARGFRNLKDLRERAELTRAQRIGLEFHRDLQERIPREEVEEIRDLVEKEVEKLGGSSWRVEAVGSYRRGKPDCGDVDLLIVNGGRPRSTGEFLMALTDSLKAQGCLTIDLVNLTAETEKYFGIFKLPGENRIHRRIDLFVVPQSEYASALFHYTGSALFNRTVRLLAGKRNMILTEHGLYSDTFRTGSETTSRGRLIQTLTEEDIFKELGLPYRFPEERDD